MLTAAVRDLHMCYPGRFLTDVRTACPELWQHNPYLTPLKDNDPEVKAVDCYYPLINQSNQRPYHFIHGFIADLNEKLELDINVLLGTRVVNSPGGAAAISLTLSPQIHTPPARAASASVW